MQITKEYLLKKQAGYIQAAEGAKSQIGVYQGAVACINSMLKDLEAPEQVEPVKDPEPVVVPDTSDVDNWYHE